MVLHAPGAAARSPLVLDPARGVSEASPPSRVDVAIVGAGSLGVRLVRTLAATALPDVALLERRFETPALRSGGAVRAHRFAVDSVEVRSGGYRLVADDERVVDAFVVLVATAPERARRLLRHLPQEASAYEDVDALARERVLSVGAAAAAGGTLAARVAARLHALLGTTGGCEGSVFSGR